MSSPAGDLLRPLLGRRRVEYPHARCLRCRRTLRKRPAIGRRRRVSEEARWHPKSQARRARRNSPPSAFMIQFSDLPFVWRPMRALRPFVRYPEAGVDGAAARVHGSPRAMARHLSSAVRDVAPRAVAAPPKLLKLRRPGGRRVVRHGPCYRHGLRASHRRLILIDPASAATVFFFREPASVYGPAHRQGVVGHPSGLNAPRKGAGIQSPCCTAVCRYGDVRLRWGGESSGQARHAESGPRELNLYACDVSGFLLQRRFRDGRASRRGGLTVL
jgi:hypothetical protein